MNGNTFDDAVPTIFNDLDDTDEGCYPLLVYEHDSATIAAYVDRDDGDADRDAAVEVRGGGDDLVQQRSAAAAGYIIGPVTKHTRLRDRAAAIEDFRMPAIMVEVHDHGAWPACLGTTTALATTAG